MMLIGDEPQSYPSYRDIAVPPDAISPKLVQCPLMALFGHPTGTDECPLSGGLCCKTRLMEVGKHDSLELKRSMSGAGHDGWLTAGQGQLWS